MTEKELKQKLSKYTKETIIDCIVEYRHIFHSLIDILERYNNKKKSEKAEAKFNRTFDEYVQASEKFIDLQRKLQKKIWRKF